jgi:cytochrome c peroxidase
MRSLALLVALLALLGAAGRSFVDVAYPNPSGEALTLTQGAADGAAFFEPLGANGRACGTCHLPSDGWSLSPGTVRRLFDATDGRHPLFRPRDGANAPNLPDGTVAERRAAHSLLLARGLIRVGLPVPADAEFTLESVDDPYRFATARELSLYRRPLPSTNLAFASTIMWDGRESRVGGAVMANFAQQATGAGAGHGQDAVLSDEQRRAIVAFETSLVTAQRRDNGANDLNADGARGGPHALAEQRFFPGINSSRQPGGFNRRVFSLFGAWADATEARRSIARGESLFNAHAFAGGNFTCTTCHNAPNTGSNSLGAMFDLGLTAESRRAPDVPLYALRCVRAGAKAAAGRVVRTTDPGAALVTGRCDDIGRFKVPTLRGLAARAPYFHDGSAATLADVVDFYDKRFAIALTPAERADLLAFLGAL